MYQAQDVLVGIPKNQKPANLEGLFFVTLPEAVGRLALIVLPNTTSCCASKPNWARQPLMPAGAPSVAEKT